LLLSQNRRFPFIASSPLKLLQPTTVYAINHDFRQIHRWTLPHYISPLQVLLVNLLIAMMSATYDEVAQESSEVWSLQYTELMLEFRSKMFLPPPLSAIPILFGLLEKGVVLSLNMILHSRMSLVPTPARFKRT
jgi:hypothetical protein